MAVLQFVCSTVEDRDFSVAGVIALARERLRQGGPLEGPVQVRVDDAGLDGAVGAAEHSAVVTCSWGLHAMGVCGGVESWVKCV